MASGLPRAPTTLQGDAELRLDEGGRVTRLMALRATSRVHHGSPVRQWTSNAIFAGSLLMPQSD